MNVSMRTGHVVRAPGASGRHALLLTGRGRARARLTVPAAARLRIVVRGRRCAGAPRLAVAIDGVRAAKRRVRAQLWTTFRSRPALAAATHAIALRLANPHRSRHCRRGVFVDLLAAKASPQSPPAPQPAPQGQAPGRWIPAPRTTWQWQLSDAGRLSVAAQMYDIDLFDNGAERRRGPARRGPRVRLLLRAPARSRPAAPTPAPSPPTVIGKRARGLAGRALARHPPRSTCSGRSSSAAWTCAGRRASTASRPTTSTPTPTPAGSPSPPPTSCASTASSPPPRTRAACRSG